MFTQVLQRQPVLGSVFCCLMYRCQVLKVRWTFVSTDRSGTETWQCKRACVNMLIFYLILKSSEPHYLSLNATAYFYVLLETILRFAQFIRAFYSSLSFVSFSLSRI